MRAGDPAPRDEALIRIAPLESHEQLHIADVLRDHREQLEAARKELSPDLDAHGVPTHPIGSRMLAVEARMLDVENALVADLKSRERRERRNPVLYARKRLREVLRPRIGMLWHHSPVALTVPRHYFAARPPRFAPKVSIVTPSYGQGHFLERTMNSVLSQDYPSLEYVVQDGGSVDESVDLLRRYALALTHWASEADAGQSDAINRGFAHTSGEIMAYLNSDDMLLPGALAYVASYFAKHPDVDVLYGDRLMVDEYDMLVGSWVLPRHDDAELALIDFVPQETLFWRRSAWERAGGRVDPTLRFAIDWDLLLRFRETGARIVHVRRFLGAFRVHAEQKTTTLHDVCIEECDALRKRVHGRPLLHDEAVRLARPYMRRHVPQHLSRQLKWRLLWRREPVDFTLPGRVGLDRGATQIASGSDGSGAAASSR